MVLNEITGSAMERWWKSAGVYFFQCKNHRSKITQNVLYVPGLYSPLIKHIKLTCFCICVPQGFTVVTIIAIKL